MEGESRCHSPYQRPKFLSDVRGSPSARNPFAPSATSRLQKQARLRIRPFAANALRPLGTESPVRRRSDNRSTNLVPASKGRARRPPGRKTRRLGPRALVKLPVRGGPPDAQVKPSRTPPLRRAAGPPDQEPRARSLQDVPDKTRKKSLFSRREVTFSQKIVKHPLKPKQTLSLSALFSPQPGVRTPGT